MPYDEVIADRVRRLMRNRRGQLEKKMFGGVGFLLRGNMCCGVWKEFLILRVGREQYAECLAKPFTQEFDITGRPMQGWVMVEPGGFKTDTDLQDWIALAVDICRTLPAK